MKDFNSLITRFWQWVGPLLVRVLQLRRTNGNDGNTVPLDQKEAIVFLENEVSRLSAEVEAFRVELKKERIASRPQTRL